MTITVKLADLRVGRDTWPRTCLDHERVGMFEAHLRAGDGLPPIEIVDRGDGSYLIADGVHRCKAARRVGWIEIEAVLVIPIDSESPSDCALRRALETSTTGSLQLTYAERRRAARQLLDTRGDLSHRAIARLCGVAHSSVDRWSEQVAESDDHQVEDSSASSAIRLPSADEAARRLVGFLTKLDQSRGLLDYLAASRMGRHLADAFEHRSGESALPQARLFAKWTAQAVRTLEERT